MPHKVIWLTVVVLPAAEADQVPHSSMNAWAVEISPVLLDWNMTCWLAVDSVPLATTDWFHCPLHCRVSPAGPTAWAVISACSHHRQVVAAVGASGGHGVARVVPRVPAVGSQPRTAWKVAAEVVAIVP